MDDSKVGAGSVLRKGVFAAGWVCFAAPDWLTGRVMAKPPGALAARIYFWPPKVRRGFLIPTPSETRAAASVPSSMSPGCPPGGALRHLVPPPRCSWFHGLGEGAEELGEPHRHGPEEGG